MIPSFPPGTMALTQGQVVQVISSSIDENTNITSYAVKSGNAIFITTSDQLTAIPLLSTKSISTSSVTASTSRSSRSRSTRSTHSKSRSNHKIQHHQPTNLPTTIPPPQFHPVDVVSILDNISLGGSTIERIYTA